MEEKKKLVVPGDHVGIEEEYIPSSGVYSKDGELYASSLGDLDLDSTNHNAKVQAKTNIPKMQGEANIVVGNVAQMNDNVAIIDLMPMNSKAFKMVPNEASAVLRVSDTRRGFVRSLRDELGVGDIVRAKIIEANEHSVRLRIDERELGVIKAYCKSCRGVLRLDDRDLKCEKCGNIEHRKMAQDYGTGRVI